MRITIPVENNDVLAAVQSFLRKLLDSGLVDALYVPLEGADGTLIPSLVVDPVLLEDANPLSPVMPINGARAVSALTIKGDSFRLGAVLRPCELRALIELVKLQQASLEKLILISFDCPGTYEMIDYQASQRAGSCDLNLYLSATLEGSEPAPGQTGLRSACQMCIQPVPENADISLQIFGARLDQGIPATMSGELCEKLGYLPEEPPAEDARQTILDRKIQVRRQVRDSQLSGIQEKIATEGGIAGLFAACIRCHNCMTVCPICYCKTCLFKTASFDHPPEHYYRMAQRKGATRMLGDTLLFHLTRLNHMSASCVSCGMCTSACPADIPVGAIFSAIGAKVQAVFGYVPGRSVAETLPLITFQANEWTEVGEAK
jgi:formate dehydrogenase subunit beta